MLVEPPQLVEPLRLLPHPLLVETCWSQLLPTRPQPLRLVVLMFMQQARRLPLN